MAISVILAAILQLSSCGLSTATFTTSASTKSNNSIIETANGYTICWAADPIDDVESIDDCHGTINVIYSNVAEPSSSSISLLPGECIEGTNGTCFGLLCNINTDSTGEGIVTINEGEFTADLFSNCIINGLYGCWTSNRKPVGFGLRKHKVPGIDGDNSTQSKDSAINHELFKRMAELHPHDDPKDPEDSKQGTTCTKFDGSAPDKVACHQVIDLLSPAAVGTCIGSICNNRDVAIKVNLATMATTMTAEVYDKCILSGEYGDWVDEDVRATLWLEVPDDQLPENPVPPPPKIARAQAAPTEFNNGTIFAPPATAYGEALCYGRADDPRVDSQGAIDCQQALASITFVKDPNDVDSILEPGP
ncbi:hypothetical protein QBC43DRAFT_334126 [Cladorrhinum sp. PSN259]|nr:hypothetical protein QBC43DRAFT_334126 [Cladorrhinum sp. PSN259]